jgi:hypothetical protein
VLQLRLLSEFELREAAGTRTDDRALVVAAVTPTLKVVTAAMGYMIRSLLPSHTLKLNTFKTLTPFPSIPRRQHTFTRDSKGNMPAKNELFGM